MGGINMTDKLLHKISQNDTDRSYYRSHMQATLDHQHDISIAKKEIREELQKKLEAELDEMRKEMQKMRKEEPPEGK
jgi:thiamine pyrophosphate-dependent acetolactate synthase large subunit-like protein